MTIERYVPYGVADFIWDAVGDYVRQVAENTNPASRLDALKTLRITTRFMSWAMDTAALDLGPALFNPLLIERFIERHAGGNPASQRRTEQRLRRIAAAATSGALLPATSRDEPPVAQPYSKADEARQNSWASSHPQPWRRRDSAFILAVCRGTGIDASEMTDLAVDDFDVTSGHTVLRVRGANPRLIPMFEDQAALLWAAVENHEVDGFLLSGYGRSRPELMKAYKKRPKVGKPIPRRIRSTWIVRHLSARAPLPEFLAAAGLASATALDRYLPYVTPTPASIELLAGTEVAE